MATTDDLSIEGLLDILATKMDLDLRGYKRTTLERRIRRRMLQVKVATFGDYANLLRQDDSEKSRLLDTILINVTEFFREPQAWQVIATDVLPQLFKKKHIGDSLRVWAAGCSSGEEVYTLAILIAEHLGTRLPEFDIKIYATDIDEDALNVARRAEYPSSHLRRIDSAMRAKYFQGESVMRVNREIRRMVIFGKSDLVRDAPISHVDMVVCRNVLIYFDLPTQKHIISRLHYALLPGGVLFLGKAESKLLESRLFIPIDSRWRIFRRDGSGEAQIPEVILSEERTERDGEVSLLRVYHRTILDGLNPGVVTLDKDDKVIGVNESARNLFRLGTMQLSGVPLANTPFAIRCPELHVNLQSSKAGQDHVQFHFTMANEGERQVLEISLRPIAGEQHARIGTLIYAEDVTHRERLQQTIEQLEATSEELQSANEELETTNEELQSTNEELETTNEELQSTNEELETTNEELQSLNEELENMNEELEHRTRDLDVLNSRYANTLEHLPWAVMLVESGNRVQFWNSAASRLFNLPGSSVIGLEIAQLPVPSSLRSVLARKARAVFETGNRATLRNQQISSGPKNVRVHIHFNLTESRGKDRGVLIMFSPLEDASNRPALKSARSAQQKSKRIEALARKTTNKKKNAKSAAKKKKA